mmetsp:Transcript_25136/g.30612  ORF Transcript_25136/g.30612 Transcript_25136/m.30612 type:complete len:96 (-) Transcript_25136:17-304(-)
MDKYDENINIISNYWYLFVMSCLLGFMVMLSSFMVTKYFSGLYLKALSVFRNFILVCGNVIFIGEIITYNQIIGYGISIIGFIYYNYIRITQKKS